MPELSTQSQPHFVARIDAARAVAGARLVARREAYLPGASGGAVVAALLGATPPADLAADTPENDDAVLIFHDHGYAYLDTVYSYAWVRESTWATPRNWRTPYERNKGSHHRDRPARTGSPWT